MYPLLLLISLKEVAVINLAVSLQRCKLTLKVTAYYILKRVIASVCHTLQLTLLLQFFKLAGKKGQALAAMSLPQSYFDCGGYLSFRE